MNNTFNLKRFILLFKKHTIEHAKTYLLSIAVLAGIIALSLGFFAYSNRGRLAVPAQTVAFIYCIALAGGIFTSVAFTDLANKRKATGVLTLPASHFEKYLVTWLYTFIIYQLITVSVFYMIDWIVISISNPPADSPNRLLNVFTTDQKGFAGFILFAIFHAFAIWGAIFFDKLHFIKTAFVFFIYIIALAVIGPPLLRLVTGNKYLYGPPFLGMEFIQDKHFWAIEPTAVMKNTNIIMLGIIIILFWISAFFRLKEKEI